MPKRGLEPLQRFHHQNLNLARLPIPPLRHEGYYINPGDESCQPEGTLGKNLSPDPENAFHLANLVHERLELDEVLNLNDKGYMAFLVLGR